MIRIWAYTVIDKWCLLYEAGSAWHSEKSIPRANMFLPNINKISLPTRVIKIEFNHSKLDYFTEIDAVVLVGKKYTMHQSQYKNLLKRKQNYKGPIQKRLEFQLVRFQPRNDQDRAIQEFFQYDFNRFVQEAGLEDAEVAETEEGESLKQLTLNALPYEVLFKILSLLDLRSLFRVAQVDRTLYDVATDPLLYTEVSLKSYWHVANNSVIQSLTKRGRLMRKLDLSWCGLFNSITASDFKEYVFRQNICIKTFYQFFIAYFFQFHQNPWIYLNSLKTQFL